MNAQKPVKPLKIIIGIDGSEDSLAATKLIGDLVLPKESMVTLLGVQTRFESPGRSTLLTAHEKAEAILKKADLTVKTGMLHGHPAQELAEFAKRYKVDLIAIGAQGLRATKHILVGGTAQQIVEYASAPVLIVRSPYQGIMRVLVAVDESEYSKEAVDYLTVFPLPEGVKVEVMHVLHTPLASAGIEEGDEKEKAEVGEEKARKLVEDAVKKLNEAGVDAKAVFAYGDAATEIDEHIQEQAIDLVVTGSRGLNAIRGWMLGSVSRKLVHYAHASVLVVRVQEDEEEF
jgi:nucleotide-binding universal stress UspA family protein